MTSRKIPMSGAGRRTTTGEYLILLLGGAGTEAPPDWSEGEGRGSTVPRPSLHLKVGFAPEDTERSVSGQECEVVDEDDEDRSFVQLDRFALADVRRAHGLTPVQAYVLLMLTCQAGYRRPYMYQATLHELADLTGHGMETVKDCMTRLEAEGLIAILTPFGRGKKGTYEVLAYRELIVPPRPKKTPRTQPVENEKATDSELQAETVRFSVGIGEWGDVSTGESLTRGVGLHDEALGGAYRRLRQAFPGAEEVS